VLATVVGILCYRVYVVLDPPPIEEGPMLSPPKPRLPGPDEDREGLDLPELPPPRPPMDVPGAYVALYKRNPLTTSSDKPTQSAGKQGQEDYGIKLLKISQARGRWRAQLQTQTTKQWYEENEPFEKFELQEIDPEEETVVVYSEEHGRRITLKIQ